MFSTKDAYLATAVDFEIQSEFHVELTGEARALSGLPPLQ